MAQHDYNIANQSGADFRADLNNALLAIATVNSGSTEPSTTFAHQLWVDTSSSVLKIRNAADNAWVTTGVSITASNTFTGNLTGNVTGNLTGNVTGNVTGDLTGNADTATTLATARTISLSGDVAGSASFDGSGDITISTTAQIDSITLGTDTTGDYVESMSGGTGVTVTGGTGEGSTPSVAIGQAVATTDDVTFNIVTATEEFIGDIDGAVRFTAKTDEALSKGDVVYVSGVSGNTTTVGKAKADDASKMPAFGMAIEDANANNNLQIVTFGNLTSIDTSNESVGEILYVSTTAGEYTTTAPSGESAQIQNIGKVLRSHAVNGSIKVGGAGRSNATPNLDNGKIFIGNGSNQAVTSTLDTSIVVENTNLYYTTARVNSAFDTRLATKDTDDVAEGTTNLYYTSARANTDFDTRLATKSTTNIAEGSNLYYTTARFDSAFTSKDTDDLSEGDNLYYTQARFDSAFGNKTTANLTENTNLYYTDTRANSAIDARVTKAFVDALGIQATSVAADSVALGTDTTGNYVSTITGTANKITVSGSGSESANITLSLPDDVQIASDLTVAGNLTVNGTLTSLDTTNLDIEDNLFQLNAGLTGSPVNDSGMLINRGTADNSIFMWDESADKFTLGLTTADGSATGNITLSSLGTLVANIEGAVTGNVTGTVSSLSNHDTDDLAEGTNLYYTQARFDSAFTAKSTSDLSEGTNLYYTDARFDTRLATKDTDDVSEGTTNLYYTDARSRSAISATGDISYNSSTGVISFTQSTAPVTSVNTQTGAVVLDTDDIGEGSTNLYYTNARADARVNLQTGANLDLSSKSTSDLSEGSNLYYTDARFDTRLATKDTGDLAEGSNLYYTDARVQAVSINNVVEDTTPQLGGDLASNGNDILFADNDKAVFGAGSDLQIYHDGSNSRIQEGGTGSLLVRGTNLQLQDSDGYDYLTCTDGGNGGTVALKHLGSTVFSTTSTGIDVTGTVELDNLTIAGAQGTDGQVLTSTGSGIAWEDASGGTATTINNNADNRVITGSNTANTLNGEANFVFDGTNVGIGTTSPDHLLEIETASSSVAPKLGFRNTQAGVQIGMPANTNALYFVTGDNERMRLTSTGLGIGTTSNDGRLHVVDDTANPQLTVHKNSSGVSDAMRVRHGRGLSGFSGTGISFRRNDNTQVGAVVIGFTSTTYQTSSDYRLKENVDYEFNALDRVAQLKPARFNFIEDADITVDGFLAHEVQDIVPQAITGEKDAVDDEGNPEYQGIDQSKLVPLLTKAIQEQQELINNLTARIEQLEN
jgi:hypothetical protein